MEDQATPKADRAKRSRLRRSSAATVKLEDVAKFANVSTATASRVINAPSTVSEKTRARVQEAIAQLGWIPHGAAQALARLKTRTIGALIPTLGHQSIATMLEALQQVLRAEGYTLLLGRPDDAQQRTVEDAAKMIQNGVECIILMGEDQPPELFELLKQRKVFHVVIYTSGTAGHSNCIGFDNAKAMSKVVSHLLDLGHTRFGVIARSFEGNDRIRLRVQAIRETLAQAGLAVRPQHFKIVPYWHISCGRDGMREILNGDLRPTAVICTNDYLAYGAIAEARAAGLVIPRDISVTGFDDVELAAHIEPPLTTIHVPAHELGQAIAQYIVETLETGSSVLPPPFECELIVRGSTGAPAA